LKARYFFEIGDFSTQMANKSCLNVALHVKYFESKRLSLLGFGVVAHKEHPNVTKTIYF